MAIRLHLPPNGKRLIYDLTPFGLPEVPYFAAMNLPFTSTALPTHTHKERMEINLILKGERVYRVGGKDYHLRGNQIFFTWPGEMHGTGSYLHGRGLHFWMQVALPKPGKCFLNFDADGVAPLLESLWKMPRRQFRADPGMRDIYVRMLDICRQGPSRLAGIELAALMMQWFLLFEAASRKEWEEEITPDIARALELMSRVPYRHVSIDDLAGEACLSESRFKGKFKEQVGMPPGEFLLRRRTEVAADMLMKGRLNATEIALELGFSSAQHFSLTFKKFFGLSPQSWMEKQDDLGLGKQGMENDDHEDEGVRPWIDDNGLLHGYVYESYPGGNHPS
jgi:AraC-type DNA-binding domain-containing proteins